MSIHIQGDNDYRLDCTHMQYLEQGPNHTKGHFIMEFGHVHEKGLWANMNPFSRGFLTLNETIWGLWPWTTSCLKTLTWVRPWHLHHRTASPPLVLSCAFYLYRFEVFQESFQWINLLCNVTIDRSASRWDIRKASQIRNTSDWFFDNHHHRQTPTSHLPGTSLNSPS